MTSKTNNIEIDTQQLINKMSELEQLANGDVARMIELLLLENHIFKLNQSSGMLRRRKLDFSEFPRFLKLTDLSADEISSGKNKN